MKSMTAGGEVDLELFCIDGSVVRAHQSAAGASKKLPAGEPADHALGRSQGGFGTKLHLICDGRCVPRAVTLSPGQQHETQQFEALMEEVIAWPVLPERLAGDKSYSANRIRGWLNEHGIKDVIPTRKNEARDRKFDKRRYRRRNIVERCIGSLK
jgi:transposase